MKRLVNKKYINNSHKICIKSGIKTVIKSDKKLIYKNSVKFKTQLCIYLMINQPLSVQHSSLPFDLSW